MKRVVFLLTTLLLSVSETYAAPFSASATVYTLRSRDSVFFGTDADWFSLVGVTSLGTCPIGDGGYVVIMFRDDSRGQRMFSLVLPAKSAVIPPTIPADQTPTSP